MRLVIRTPYYVATYADTRPLADRLAALVRRALDRVRAASEVRS